MSRAKSPDRKRSPLQSPRVDADFTEKSKPQELTNQIFEGRRALKLKLERIGGDESGDAKNTVTFVKTMTNSNGEEIDYFVIKPNIGTLDTELVKGAIEKLGCKIITVKKELMSVSISTNKYDRRKLAINMSSSECVQYTCLCLVAFIMVLFGAFSIARSIDQSGVNLQSTPSSLV
jgi:hypothetical protein